MEWNVKYISGKSDVKKALPGILRNEMERVPLRNPQLHISTDHLMLRSEKFDFLEALSFNPIPHLTLVNPTLTNPALCAAPRPHPVRDPTIVPGIRLHEQT